GNGRGGGKNDSDAGGGEPGVGAEEEGKEGAVAAAVAAAAATPVTVVSLRKEKAAKFRAAAERVRLIVGRLEVSRDVTSPAAAAAAAEGGVEAAPAHGGDVSFFPAARAVWEDEEESGGGEAEREDEGVEAFRSEFVESVAEVGGLKALTLSWTGVARLEEAFLAWVVEAGGNTGTDLKAEILRVSSLAEALVKAKPRPQLAGQGSSSSSPGFPSLARLLGSGALSSNGSSNFYRASYEGPAGVAAAQGPTPSAAAAAAAATMMSNNVDDHHKSLPLAAEPPVGAPLRPRHHVCRDRLSAAAAAALLRGADDGGGGGGGGGCKGETVVTFAGSSGAGKACLAAEVVGRRDVRAKFGDGVLWLQVG
ncbi:unnamed protein product, partial [Ectocarpus fasciculatus]